MERRKNETQERERQKRKYKFSQLIRQLKQFKTPRHSRSCWFVLQDQIRKNLQKKRVLYCFNIIDIYIVFECVYIFYRVFVLYILLLVFFSFIF